MLRTLLLATVLALSSGGCSGSGVEERPEPTATPTAAIEDAGTAPGTDLGFGESAVLVWHPEADVTGRLELSVDRVSEQDQSVFDGWVRDEAMAASRPYFVGVTVANAGESDLGAQAVPLYLRDDAGALGAPWTLGGAFTDCQSGPLPDPFPAGTEVEMCLVYLVPDGRRIRDMVFEPTEGYDPITWTGDVQPPEEPRQPGKDRKGGKERG
jgi:hypothetical protein